MQTNFNSAILVGPIQFDWKALPSVPHTYACMVVGVAIGLYEQPSDKSHWISLTGPAGRPFPDSPKKFPNRSLAEQWAADTLRLVFMAQTTETTMTPDNPNEGTANPLPEPTQPGQQPPFDPKDQPKDDELNKPGPDFNTEIDLEDGDNDEGDDDDGDADDATGFDDE